MASKRERVHTLTESQGTPEARLSFWQRTAPTEDAGESLRGALEADVIVVGGGMAGLGTALGLMEAQPGLNLAVLEARDLGYGASGRNAGIVEAPMMMPTWLLDGSLPPAEARWAIGWLQRRAEAEMQRWLSVCSREDLRPARVLIGARSRLSAAALRHAQSRLEAALVRADWLPAAEVEAACGAQGFGALSLAGYAVNPLALLRAAAAAARRAGARVFCDTQVTRLLAATPTGVELETKTGQRVRARAVVLCAGAWSRGALEPARPDVLPIATYMLASEPLDDATLQRLGGEDICISEVFSMTYRRVHGRRLLFGGTGKLVKAAEPPAAFDERRIAKLRSVLAKSLPWLRGVDFQMAWGGPTSSTPRGAPIVAADPLRPGLFWNAGYGAFLPALFSGTLVRGLVLGPKQEDPEGERFRRAYANTRISWSRALGLGLRLLWRSAAVSRHA